MSTLFPNLHKIAQRCPLVLGSGSPRRLELLTGTGVPFAQIISHLEESRLPDEPPHHYASRLAEDKAREVAARAERHALVIGCDTIVVLEDQVLEKPADKGEAFRMLRLLSGRRHVVCSALAVFGEKKVLASGHELTAVYFNRASRVQIWDYIESGEPMDKAGAYGIQGMGAFLVDRIEGNLDTVIGLPRTLLETLAGDVLLRLQ